MTNLVSVQRLRGPTGCSLPSVRVSLSSPAESHNFQFGAIRIYGRAAPGAAGLAVGTKVTLLEWLLLSTMKPSYEGIILIDFRDSL